MNQQGEQRASRREGVTTIRDAATVLALWTECEMGSPTGLRPRGLERRSPLRGQTAAQQGHAYIRACPLYSRCERSLRARFVHRNWSDLDRRWIRQFVRLLRRRLLDVPCEIKEMYSERGGLEESIAVVSEVEAAAMERTVKRFVA